uniref:Uncharacterized protein n=1 Tax=Oryza glumipatula TaxID=40148 RepID=A0A0E0BKX1_9ORYZ
MWPRPQQQLGNGRPQKVPCEKKSVRHMNFPSPCGGVGLCDRTWILCDGVLC